MNLLGVILKNGTSFKIDGVSDKQIEGITAALNEDIFFTVQCDGGGYSINCAEVLCIKWSLSPPAAETETE